MIREANLADIEVLTRLLNLLFTQESEFKPDKNLQTKALKKIIKSKKLGDIFVLQKKNKIVAMVNILYSYSTALGSKVATLEDMVVDEKHRQKGYGSKLLKEVLKILRKKNIKRVTLLSDWDNEIAHKFYKDFGFIESNMKVFRKLNL